MTNYLIMSGKSPEHCFFKPYEGICIRKKQPGGLWSEHESVLSEGKDGFGLYADGSGNVHLISINDENCLVYAVRKNNVWKKYIISKLSEDIYVSNMQLYNVKGRLNLLYSALYNGENLLIHCVLGDHAKPSTIATLEDPHFFIYAENVYFTNTDGALGFISLADEKPVGFNKLYDNAHSAYISRFSGKEFLIFMRDSNLFVNGEQIISDNRMETPICIRGNDRLYIMWKSGSFVRYITSFNLGTTWSDPMRFMSTNTTISLYFVQHGETMTRLYGHHTSNEIVTFGRSEVFQEKAEYEVPVPNELEKLKELLDITRQEITNAKKEITRLNTTIDKLKGIKQ